MTMPTVHERLSSDPAPLIQQSFGAAHINEDVDSLADQLRVHRAQVVMLTECDIIRAEDGAALLGALDKLEREGVEIVPLRPELNDLISCIEAWIIGELGEEVGGRLHTGRSRNDLSLALSRMATRSALLDLIGDVLELRQVLLERASEHAETLFPGYTHHTQQAQPITFGHFLLGFQDGLERDGERLREAYRRVNRSTLGGAALAGTGFSIDRQRLAELLGFDGFIEHTADAAGTRDFQLEAAAAAVILASTIDRLVEAMIVFTSTEFGYLELDDSLASISSIMPQKKNPVSLEMVEAMLARISGAVVTMLMHLKSSTLGVSREVVYCDGELSRALADARLATQLTSLSVQTVRVDAARARQGVDLGLSTATDLADALVRDHDLSFRQAHRVVGRAIAEITASDRGGQITPALLDEVAREVLGEEIGISDDEVRAACDPQRSVDSRRTTGGPAPDEVRRMLEDRRRVVTRHERELEETRAALREADIRLRTAASTILEPSDA